MRGPVHRRTMPPQRKDICDCGVLEQMADNPTNPVEFDAELNEFHITHSGGGYSMIYYCPFCGGSAPKSKRDRFFHILTDAERERLLYLTKDMQTVQDVIHALGEPDFRFPVGIVVSKTDKDDLEMTQSYPTMMYTKVSETADLHVTVYPTDRVSVCIQRKGKKQAT